MEELGLSIQKKAIRVRESETLAPLIRDNGQLKLGN